MIRQVYLIARRDYLGYVTAWGFWLGLLLTPMLIGAGIMIPALAASSEPVRHYTVIDQQGDFRAALELQITRDQADAVRLQLEAMAAISGDTDSGLEALEAALMAGESLEAAITAAGKDGEVTLPSASYQYVRPPAETIEALRPWLLEERLLQTPEGPRPLFAAIHVTGETIEYWSDSVTVSSLKRPVRLAAEALARDRVFAETGVDPGILGQIADQTLPLVEKRARPGEDASTEVTLADRAPFIVSIAIAFMLWTLIFSVVNYLLMGTIEERSNKIFDSLLTSVKLIDLLAGKLLAVLAVSLTLMAVWGIGGTAVSVLVGSLLPAGASDMVANFAAAALKPAILIPAALSFLLGYLMYGSLFLALGSLCDTIQEAQTLMTPLLVLLMVPLFMVVIAIDNPESSIIGAMSWVPVFTPFLLILRMPTQPPLWETIALLGLMALATFTILWLAARVYRAGAVHGAGVNDAMAWAKARFGRKAT